MKLAFFLSLDQEKAFERVNKNFLLNLLERFGFGPSFIRWISTLYNGANMQIIVNGFLTDPVPLACGVRQGDSLSPLFIFFVSKFSPAKLKNVLKSEAFSSRGRGGLNTKLAYMRTTQLVSLRPFHL